MPETALHPREVIAIGALSQQNISKTHGYRLLNFWRFLDREKTHLSAELGLSSGVSLEAGLYL